MFHVGLLESINIFVLDSLASLFISQLNISVGQQWPTVAGIFRQKAITVHGSSIQTVAEFISLAVASATATRTASSG